MEPSNLCSFCWMNIKCVRSCILLGRCRIHPFNRNKATLLIATWVCFSVMSKLSRPSVCLCRSLLSAEDTKESWQQTVNLTGICIHMGTYVKVRASLRLRWWLNLVSPYKLYLALVKISFKHLSTNPMKKNLFAFENENPQSFSGKAAMWCRLNTARTATGNRDVNKGKCHRWKCIVAPATKPNCSPLVRVIGYLQKPNPIGTPKCWLASDKSLLFLRQSTHSIPHKMDYGFLSVGKRKTEGSSNPHFWNFLTSKLDLIF